jgi:hypothetical protein
MVKTVLKILEEHLIRNLWKLVAKTSKCAYRTAPLATTKSTANKDWFESLAIFSYGQEWSGRTLP